MKKYIFILILYSLGVSVYSQKSSNRATETLTNVYEQAKQTRKSSNRAADIKKDLDKQAEQTNKCIEQAVEQAKRMIHSSMINSADEYVYVLYAGGRKIAEFSSQRECDDQVNNFKRLVENGIKQCISDRQAQIAVIGKAYNSLNLVGKKEKNLNYKSGNISGLYNPAGYNVSDTDEKSASNLSGRIFTPSSDNKTPPKELSSLLVSDPKDRKAFSLSDLSVRTNTISSRPQGNTSGIAYGSIPKFNEKPVAFPDTKIPIAVTVRNIPKVAVKEEIKYGHPYIELGAEIVKSFPDISFISSIDILPEGLILLSSSTKFYTLGIGGIFPFSGKSQESICSFTQTPDEALMLICDEQLCYLDSVGEIQKLFRLPNDGMRIKSGKDVLYLFDSDISKEKYTIYLLLKGGQYITLLDYFYPVTDILETDNYLFFSSKNKIMRVNIEQKEIVEIVSLPNSSEIIISLTADKQNGQIYFSTNNSIYRLANRKIECINNELGGLLYYDNGGLLLFLPEKPLLIRFRNNILH
ncbi:hypothetical protein FACS1894182_09770 [Bacteroidia bacterium]|nr:hypothetical protein FACS1894182_09770 [Bacteroidia bacterium]